MHSLNYKRAYEIALILVPSALVLLPHFTSLAFIIWGLVIIVGAITKNIVFVRPSKIGILFSVLLLVYIIGSFFTNHPDIAGKYIEYKASLLVVPLLFCFQPKDCIRIDSILNSFVFAVLILGFCYLLRVLISAYPHYGLNEVTSSNFSYTHHPTYSSVFAFFAMIISLLGLKRDKISNKRWIWFGLIFFFVVIQLMCLSLAGLLFLMIFFCGYIFYIAYKKFKIKGLIGITIVVPVFIVITFKILPGFSTQFGTSKQYLVEYISNPIEFVKSKKTYIGGNETRLIMWTAATQEIVKHPFGVGTGNTDDYLESWLQKMGHSEMAKKMYNPHNQFLQTTLEIGIVGLLVLVGIIFIGFYQGIKTRNWLLVLIVANLVFNCLFESMLQRQSGIVFYVFWMVFLTNIYFKKAVKKDESNLN